MSSTEVQPQPSKDVERVDVLIDEPRHQEQQREMVIIPEWAVIEELAAIDEYVQQTPVSPNEPV